MRRRDTIPGRLSLSGCAVLLLLALLIPSRAWCLGSPVVINEIFVDGSSNYPDWIELYNKGKTPVFLKGYSLTNNLEETRWTIRDDFVLGPGDIKVFYCDTENRYDHVGFRLDSISGEVGLIAPDGEQADAVIYNDLPRFSSLGRWPDGTGAFCVHASPTKGLPNRRSRTYLRFPRKNPVLFSQASGRYPAPFDLSLSAPDGLRIHYTTDGSLPGTDSRIYDAPLHIDKTTVIRAAAVNAQGKPFAVTTRSYILDEHTRLPVVSLVTAPKNLWDSEIGIYADGDSCKNGPGNSQNWRHNWRRPVHLDFLDNDDGWTVEGKMRIMGGVSRARRQKSLAIYTPGPNDPYGIRHELFPGTRRSRYAGLLLRNGGDAWMRTQIRDAFQQELVRGRVACDTQDYRPVIVYLNGDYWGLYGLRDLMTRKNLLERRHLPSQRVALLSGGSEISSDKGPFAHMPPIPANGDYRPALSALDVDAFLDYLIVELYSGNPDWPDGNIKCWRPKSSGAKWRWILFDLDRGFSGKRGVPAEASPFDVLYQRPGGRGLMFGELAGNRRFVRDFCARLSVHMLTTFAPERAAALLDRMTAAIRPEMQRHIDRWRWDWKPQRLFMSLKKWDAYLDELRDFCRRRRPAMLRILDNEFGVGEAVPIKVRIACKGPGRITAEDVLLENGRLEGPVPQSLAIRIKAVPTPGHVFSGWLQHPENGSQLTIKPGQTFIDTAVFAPAALPKEEE